MVDANGIYKLAVIGTVQGQQHIHTLHFRSTAAGSSVGFSEPNWQQDLIDGWQTNCRTAYRAMFYAADNPCQSYQVRKVCGTLPLPAGIDEGEVPASSAGTNGAPAGQFAAPWLANVVTERTAFAGRRYRGRMFLGGLAEEQINGALIEANRITLTTAYTTALTTNYITPIETAVNAKLFVYSRTQARVPGIQCQNAGADVTSFQVRTGLATMKSRKAGSGI